MQKISRKEIPELIIHLIFSNDDELSNCNVPINPDYITNKIINKFSTNKDIVTCAKCLREFNKKELKSLDDLELNIIEIMKEMKIITTVRVKDKLAIRRKHINRKYLQELIDKYHLKDISFEKTRKTNHSSNCLSHQSANQI